VSRYVPVQTEDFAEFYEASYRRVVALVAAIVGDRHQAEDIAQEAFSRALTRWQRVARYDLPEAWVRRVALRLTVDATRRMHRARIMSVLLAAGQRGASGRRYDPHDPLEVTALSLALMRLPDRTVSFEWGPGNNLHPPGLGLRVLDVAAPGNLLQASRLVVAAGRYCAAHGAWCASPVITADGSKIMVGRSTVRGSRYSNSVMEFATRTGRAAAVVTSVIVNGFPGRPCVPLWSNPAGEQVLSYCGRGERYDHGHISLITLHIPMYGTNLEPFAW
jgi:Sigma-70 region 2